VLKNTLLAVGIAVVSAAAVIAASTERWLHVRVETDRGVNSGVTINVPIAMASAMLPATTSGEPHHRKLSLQASVNGTDLRAILDAIHSSSDGSSIHIDRANKKITVTKLGDDVKIDIAQQPSPDHPTTETIAVKVPIPVLKAMLGGGGSEDLDIGAGLRVLAQHGEVDLTIHKEKETVRIWTDLMSE
jgi:hypothetical protein